MRHHCQRFRHGRRGRDAPRAPQLLIHECRGRRRLLLDGHRADHVIRTIGQQRHQRLLHAGRQHGVQPAHHHAPQPFQRERRGPPQRQQRLHGARHHPHRGGEHAARPGDGRDRHHAGGLVGQQAARLLGGHQRLLGRGSDHQARRCGHALRPAAPLHGRAHGGHQHPRIGRPLQHHVLAARGARRRRPFLFVLPHTPPLRLLVSVHPSPPSARVASGGWRRLIPGRPVRPVEPASPER